MEIFLKEFFFVFFLRGGGRRVAGGSRARYNLPCRPPAMRAGAGAGSPGPKHHAKLGKELILIAP